LIIHPPARITQQPPCGMAAGRPLRHGGWAAARHCDWAAIAAWRLGDRCGMAATRRQEARVLLCVAFAGRGCRGDRPRSPAPLPALSFRTAYGGCCGLRHSRCAAVAAWRLGGGRGMAAARRQEARVLFAIAFARCGCRGDRPRSPAPLPALSFRTAYGGRSPHLRATYALCAYSYRSASIGSSLAALRAG
jgi:hypothetical protein